MTFSKWIRTFLSEKNIDLDKNLEIEGPSGLNIMPVEILVEAMEQASQAEQEGIKAMIVKIDFVNGDVLDFFKHIGQAIAR
jgi:hypothetical protein